MFWSSVIVAVIFATLLFWASGTAIPVDQPPIIRFRIVKFWANDLRPVGIQKPTLHSLIFLHSSFYFLEDKYTATHRMYGNDF